MSSQYLELLEWRRRMAELFAEVRRRPADGQTLSWFREQKDELFRSHSQSPIPAENRRGFAGLEYWPYDPSARVIASFQEAPPERTQGPSSLEEEIPLSRIGWLSFMYQERSCRLAAYWVLGYAGGIFVPLRDSTSGRESYGGGRYLLDSIKSADLGSDAERSSVVLDFNYAYHPSCAYDAHWNCPLAPAENWLNFPILAGERLTPP